MYETQGYEHDKIKFIRIQDNREVCTGKTLSAFTPSELDAFLTICSYWPS